MGMSVDKNHVYWSDEYGSRSIMKDALDGGSPVVLATGSAPTELAVDDAYVYWTDQLPAIA